MEPTLSIVLPVRDCSRQLGRSVFDWIERAADLSDHFELVIVDDGSTDGTDEVGVELARRFPQVVFTRHEKPLGRTQAVRRGLLRSKGRQIYVADLPQSELLPEAGHRTLETTPRADARTPGPADAAILDSPGGIDPDLIRRLAAWTRSARKTAPETAAVAGQPRPAAPWTRSARKTTPGMPNELQPCDSMREADAYV